MSFSPSREICWTLPPVKVHCSVLAEDAIKAAIKNYQDKQDAEAPAAAAKQEPVAVGG